MSNNSNGGGASIGFGGLLTILFIALKLTHVINWSWFWILFPTLLPIGFVIFILFVFFILALIADGSIKIKRKK